MRSSPSTHHDDNQPDDLKRRVINGTCPPRRADPDLIHLNCGNPGLGRLFGGISPLTGLISPQAAEAIHEFAQRRYEAPVTAGTTHHAG
jgi:hypothetical protein